MYNMIMKLYTYPICPISNKFKILFKRADLNIEVIPIISKKQVEKFSNINFHFFPILESDNRNFVGFSTIKNFLYKNVPNKYLTEWIENDSVHYYEEFFDTNMFFDVYKPIIFEKTQKLLIDNNYFPDQNIIKSSLKNMDFYLNTIENLLTRSNWINSQETINDFSLFSHLASLDYCFYMPWNQYPNIKEWYRRNKSKEVYNFILKNRIINFSPPKFYEEIDF